MMSAPGNATPAGATAVTVSTALAAVAELTTDEQVAALLHPVRRQVLAALAAPASPAEVARQLGMPQQVVNYHVHALADAGLAHEVETRQKRNLIEHRFRAIARSFTLSTALPLTEDQRRQLQSDVALQQLVHAGDAIRGDALRLLDTRQDAPLAAAALELDVTLPATTDRAAFIRQLTTAVRDVAAKYEGAGASAGPAASFRLHVAVYPVPDSATEEAGDGDVQSAGSPAATPRTAPR